MTLKDQSADKLITDLESPSLQAAVHISKINAPNWDSVL
jgi:hypothetical protein